MVSYAEFHQMPRQRQKAMDIGLHAYLGVPPHVQVWLDNGAFYFLSRGGETNRQEYEEFVRGARPDWYPIPQDFIPSPAMTMEQQRDCLSQTMAMNREYRHDGYVPVIHISQVIEESIIAFEADPSLAAKPMLALGGIVPNLLRMPKARPYRETLETLGRARTVFADKQLHLFGVGGTATLHVAALLGMDSVDSSGWRNRAARGMVQLPGSGERLIAQFGSCRGRKPSPADWDKLRECPCPACRQFGLEGLVARGTYGFANRATHNLWTLLEEVDWIDQHLTTGTYASEYGAHLDNSIYRPLIDEMIVSLPQLS